MNKLKEATLWWLPFLKFTPTTRLAIPCRAIVDIDYFHNGPKHNFSHVHFFDGSKIKPRGDEIDLFK